MSVEVNLLDDLLSVASKELQSLNKKDVLVETNIFDQENNVAPNKISSNGCLSAVHNGDTDSSDDEGNKNYENVRYNEYGKQIKQLLGSNYSSKSASSSSDYSKASSSWKSKPTFPSSSSCVDQPRKVEKATPTSDVYTDPIFGLRIVNPLVSSTVLKERMTGREAITFARINRYLQVHGKEKDWVIAGVIANKSAVKTSQKGSQFCIWTLTDLKDDIKTIALFLFSGAYKQLWKTAVGTVVGVLNPNVLDKKDGSKEEVCRKFNEIGSKLLSRGFIQLEKRHAVIYKRVKSLLPRRESERRAHPLSRHCDILQAVETRISMLNMTYIKYIESSLLCFIPGKVLDEMKSVLALVESNQTPPRTHQILQELRDLSSMAMEHFDEHILPRVKEQVDKRSALSYGMMASCSKSPKIVYVQHALSNELHKVKKQSKNHKHHISYLTQSTQKLCQKLRKQNIRLKTQSLKIREQERKIQEQNTKIQEQEATLADIKKHIDEWDQKYNDLTAELVRARDDILSATHSSHNSSITATQSTSPPKFYKTNIKPRMAHILPKHYLSLQLDLERKRKSNLLPEIPFKRNRTPDKDEKNQINIQNKKEINLSVPDLIDLKNDKGNKNSENLEAKGSRFVRSDIGSMISSSLENLLKNPLTSIKSRKRKMPDEIDLK